MKARVVVLQVAVIALLVASPCSSLAGTYYVSPSGSNTPPYDSWENASNTIQAAADFATDGDSILVGTGTYSPASGEQFPIQIGSDTTEVGVTITGVNGAFETVVDAQGTGRVFYFLHSSVSLNGLTIKGGSDRGIYSFRRSVSIANCRVIENHGAGVVSELTHEELSISGSTVSGNEGSGVISEGDVTINGSSISDNGGTGVNASGATVEDSEINDNEGRGISGGPNAITLVHTNVCRNGRGGVGYGDGTLSVTGCLVAGNGGDGVYVYEAIHAAIAGCTISDNSGNGVVGGTSALYLNSSIVSGNGGFGASAAPIVILGCCDLFGNKGGDWVGRIADQYGENGNFSADPLFCGGEALVNRYGLRSDSPCAPGNSPEVCSLIGARPVSCTPLLDAIVELNPNTLNLKSNGKWVTCCIELPDGHSAGDIDVASVTLNGGVHADEHTAKVGDCGCGSHPGLEVKFDRAEVEAVLSPGEHVAVTVTGNVGSEKFSGTDYIKVINPPRSKNGHDLAVRFGKGVSLDAQPNPFNPSVQIVYEVPAPARVLLQVWSVDGRLVRTLEDTERFQGVYTVEWNGRDGDGREVSSGLYVCRLNVGDAVVTKKLTLLK